MKKLSTILLVVVCGCFFAPGVTLAQEEAPAVMEVLAIDTSGATEPYLPIYEKITEIYKKLGSSGERSLWANVWAGSNTGLAIVSIRYPNLAALAADNKVVNSSEYQSVAQEFFNKGFRVASRSIVVQQR